MLTQEVLAVASASSMPYLLYARLPVFTGYAFSFAHHLLRTLFSLNDKDRIRAEQIFLEIIDADNKLELLENYPDQDNIKATVKRLIAGAEQFNIETPAFDLLSEEGIMLTPGQQVGAYTIVEEIGRGGMGVVYKAARSDGSFDRQVAIKSMKPGVMSDKHLNRFEREVSILAKLEHPNICRLYDAGRIEESPYLVMELLEGESFHAISRLSKKKTIDVFIDVCRGLVFAQERLVIHGDLKPSNLMLLVDNTPKILDFGVSVAMGDHPNRLYSAPFTLLYAAPEQLKGQKTTAATDVYSIGIMLQEATIGRADLELDAIIAKATEDQIRDRYSTAQALLDDLLAYRDNRPVSAVSTTRLYSVKKFAQRHTGVLISALLGVLALVISSIFYVNNITEARDQARYEAEVAKELADFQESLFLGANPYYNTGRLDTMRLADFFKLAAARVDSGFTGSPDVHSRLLITIGETFDGIGLPNDGIPYLKKAVELEGISPEVKAEAMSVLGITLDYLSRYNEADSILMVALQYSKEHFGMDSEITIGAILDLAPSYMFNGDTDTADSLFSIAYEWHLKNSSHTSYDRWSAYQFTARNLTYQAKWDEAIVIFEEVYEGIKDQEHLSELLHSCREQLIRAYDYGDRLEDAERMMEIHLTATAERFGTHHEEYGQGLVRMARLKSDRKLYGEAVIVLEEAERIFKRRYTEADFTTLSALHLLGTNYMRTDQHEKANAKLLEAIAMSDELYDESPSYSITPYLAMARFQYNTGNQQEAVRYVTHAYNIAQETRAPGTMLRVWADSLYALYTGSAN